MEARRQIATSWSIHRPARGLKPGSRGFCTVASHAGDVGAPGHRVGIAQPHRHRRASWVDWHKRQPRRLVACQTAIRRQVLSRAVARQRLRSRLLRLPNKLAHHVALEAPELKAGGPAWQLQQAGFMETAWEWGCRAYLQPDATTLPGSPPPAVCIAWQAARGRRGMGRRAGRGVSGEPRPAGLHSACAGNGSPAAGRRSDQFAPAGTPLGGDFQHVFYDPSPWSRLQLALRAGRFSGSQPIAAFSFKRRGSTLRSLVPPATGGPLVEIGRTDGETPRSRQSPLLHWLEQRGTNGRTTNWTRELELQPIDGALGAPPPAGGPIVFAEHTPPEKGGQYAVASYSPLPPGMPPPPPGKNRRKLEVLCIRKNAAAEGGCPSRSPRGFYLLSGLLYRSLLGDIR